MDVRVIIGSLLLCFIAGAAAAAEKTENYINAEKGHADLFPQASKNNELMKALLETLKMQNDILIRMLMEYKKEEKPETSRPCEEPEIPVDLPRNCMEVMQRHPGSPNGVYQINTGNDTGSVPVYCDMETDGGGWTVIQRRQDGSENFYRNYTDYAEGFGDLEGEFWLGNELIHTLTEDKNQEVRFDLGDFENETRFAKYDNFYVGPADKSFELEISGYTGDAGDSMARHSAMKFSTYDVDNDPWGGNCAKTYRGAWWYKHCHQSNPNGLYLKGNHSSYANGINWYNWHGHHYSLKETEIKIRPNN